MPKKKGIAPALLACFADADELDSYLKLKHNLK